MTTGLTLQTEEPTPREARASRIPVIEVIGPAGAGKSTVCALVRDALARGASAESVDGSAVARTHTRTLALALRHMPDWLPVWSALALRSPTLARRHIRHLIRLRTLAAELPRLRATAHQAVLMDEGPVLSLALLGRAHEQVRLGALSRYLDASVAVWGATLDAVVYIDAPDSVLARRIHAREKSHRVQGRSDTEVRAFLAWYRRQYRCLTLALAGGGVRLLHLSSADDSAEVLAVRVLSLIAGGARAG